MGKFKGQADGKVINQVAREALAAAMSRTPMDDGLDAIEFPAVLDVVAGYAAGALAAADLRAAHP